jgi:6-phosphogluconate dehydrogenase
MLSLAHPRTVVLLVQVGPAVDATIAAFTPYLEPGDAIVDASRPLPSRANSSLD